MTDSIAINATTFTEGGKERAEEEKNVRGRKGRRGVATG